MLLPQMACMSFSKHGHLCFCWITGIFIRSTQNNLAELKYVLGGVDDSLATYGGVHEDDVKKSHTDSMMSMGCGCVYSTSPRDILNTQSSTEAELIGANDAMAIILWTALFLWGQEYTITPNIAIRSVPIIDGQEHN